MSAIADIAAYHQSLDAESRAICERLRAIMDAHLPEAESKVWHAHPVWFLEGNPITGYSRLKDGVRLMFWSGQSFEAAGLDATGKFKAAEKLYAHPDEVDETELSAWLAEARTTQWDYKNIVKRKGRLERLS